MKKIDDAKIVEKYEISEKVYNRIVSQLENRLSGKDKIIEARKKEGFVRYFKYRTYVNAIKNLFNKKGGYNV